MGEALLITKALSSLKTSLDLAKGLRAVDKAFSEAEWKTQISGLIEHLLDAREQVFEARTEILELRQQVQELEGKLSVKEKMKFEDGVYWQLVGEEREGPYCQRCHDADEKLLRLHRVEYSRMGNKLDNPYWECKECKCEY